MWGTIITADETVSSSDRVQFSWFGLQIICACCSADRYFTRSDGVVEACDTAYRMVVHQCENGRAVEVC